VDCYLFPSSNKVVGMRNDLLFRCPGHTVAGRQSQERAFVRGKTGPGMTFHDAGKVLPKPAIPQNVSPALRMADIVGPAPADIVEHRCLFHEMKIDTGIVCCVPAGTIPYCPAVSNDFCTAPGTMQQVFPFFFLCIRHGQATS
jgi:hypothetical protein